MDSATAQHTILLHPTHRRHERAAPNAPFVVPSSRRVKRAVQFSERCLARGFEQLQSVELLRAVARLVELHTHRPMTEDAIEELLSQLWADRYRIDATRTLIEALRKGTVQPTDLRRQVEDLFSWYQARVGSLKALAASSSADFGLTISDLRVVHDQEYVGMPGLEVSCAVAAEGYRGARLWLVSGIFQNGEPVIPAEEWDGWIDRVGPVVVGHQRPFAALLPLVPEGQRAIFDQLRLFIPYAALELDRGAQQFDLSVGVREAGTELIASSMSVRIRKEQGSTGVPAPQQRGVWSEDYGSGTAIKASSRWRLAALGEGAEDALEVQVDLRIAGESGGACELTLNAVPDGEGDGVEAVALGSKRVFPVFAVDRRPAASFFIPRWQAETLLKRGLGTIELLLTDHQERVLCGDLISIPLPPNDRTEARVIGNEPTFTLKIDPVYRFADQRVFRVALQIPAKFENRIVSTRLTVRAPRREEGNPALIREVLCTADQSNAAPTVLFHLRHADLVEFAHALERKPRGDWSIRAEIVDPVSRQVLAATSATAYLDARGEAAVTEVKGDLAIVDAEVVRVGRKDLRLLVWCNAVGTTHFVLRSYIEAIDEQGRCIQLGRSSAQDVLPGLIGSWTPKVSTEFVVGEQFVSKIPRQFLIREQIFLPRGIFSRVVSRLRISVYSLGGRRLERFELAVPDRSGTLRKIRS